MARANTVSLWLAVASILLLFTAVLYPHPYPVWVFCLVLTPWLIAAYLRQQRPFLTIIGEPGQLRGNVALPLLAPCLALSFRALCDAPFATFTPTHALLIAPVSLALFTAVLWADPSPRKPAHAAILLMFILGYAAGAVALSNAILDHTATAMQPRIHSHKPRCYTERPGAFGLPWRKPIPCPRPAN